MVIAFGLIVAVVVLFFTLGVIWFAMQSEPHEKFDERYAQHATLNPRLSRLGRTCATGTRRERLL